MSDRYYFLKDKIALDEIRKHKWIESEKQNEEIGFATAALEWINVHGDNWIKHRLEKHLQSKNSQN